MKTKIIALATAFLMVAVAGVCLINVSESMDASVLDTDTVKVYVQDSNGIVNSESVYAYDLYEALNNVEVLPLAVETDSGNDLWKIDAGDYLDVNKDYGDITNIAYGQSVTIYDDTEYNVWVYTKNVSTGAYSWMSAIDALGWYHPFSDYSAIYKVGNVEYSLAAANICIVIGNAAPNVSGMIGLVSVTEFDSDYEFSFYIKGDVDPISVAVHTSNVSGNRVYIDEDDIAAGITVYGWGSNAYDALRNAIGATNVVGQQEYVVEHNMGTYSYFTYFSLIDTIFGRGTESVFTPTTSQYSWWGTKCVLDTDYEDCVFTLGYYTLLRFDEDVFSDDFKVEYTTTIYPVN